MNPQLDHPHLQALPEFPIDVTTKSGTWPVLPLTNPWPIETLEIHPSIPHRIADGLMEVSRNILANPQGYNQHEGLNPDQGCIVCKLAHILGEKMPNVFTRVNGCDGSLAPLFYLSRWPVKFQEAFSVASKRAEVAADRIEHFLRHAE